MDFHGSGLDFLWILWTWGGFSMDFMDFGWMTMDLDWIFYGFHGSGVDFRWGEIANVNINLPEVGGRGARL